MSRRVGQFDRLAFSLGVTSPPPCNRLSGRQIGRRPVPAEKRICKFLLTVQTPAFILGVPAVGEPPTRSPPPCSGRDLYGSSSRGQVQGILPLVALHRLRSVPA